mgnify:FL=1
MGAFYVLYSMYPPDQHGMHPFLLVFLDALDQSIAAADTAAHSDADTEKGLSQRGGYVATPSGERKFLIQLLFGHIFNKEVK